MRENIAKGACRVVFTIVFVLNVLCALQFIIAPEAYVSAYQLDGQAGIIALQGLGVAFLMWNATYPFFVYDPVRFRVVGAIILIQQVIGAVGESVLFCSLPPSVYEILGASIMRFMLFDGAGLLGMFVAYTALLVTMRAHRTR